MEKMAILIVFGNSGFLITDERLRLLFILFGNDYLLLYSEQVIVSIFFILPLYFL